MRTKEADRSIMNLGTCRPGQRVRVSRFEGDPDLSQRLMELGLLVGTEVSVLRAAPFQGPLEIAFEGNRLSLRRSEAEGVEILP